MAVSDQKKIGIWELSALMVSSMLGAGVFNFPGQVAKVSGPLPLVLAFLFSFLGVFSLSMVFQELNQRGLGGGWKGVQSALASDMGRTSSRLSAWGYWCSAWLGNIAYLKMIVSTIGQLFPFLGLSCPYRACFVAFVLLMGVGEFAMREMRKLSLLNLFLTIIKLAILFGGLGVLFYHFNGEQFAWHYSHWSGADGTASLFSQFKQALLVTMWLFIGFEGAVLLGQHARNQKVIKLSTFLGLSLVVSVYLLLSIATYAVVPAASIMAFPEGSSSLSGLVELLLGRSLGWLVHFGVALFAIGSLIPWVLYTGEVAQEAASLGLFPIPLEGAEWNEDPTVSKAGFRLSQNFTAVFLILSYLVGIDYDQLANIATLAMLPSYGLSAYSYLVRALRAPAFRVGPLLYGLGALIFTSLLFFGGSWDLYLLLGSILAIGQMIHWFFHYAF